MAFPTPGTHRLLRHHDMQRLRQLTFASLEQDRKKRRDIFSGADGQPDPLGAPAACAAFGILEPDDCSAALVVTGEKSVRNLPDRSCGG